jgi:hypothetical protein
MFLVRGGLRLTRLLGLPVHIPNRGEELVEVLEQIVAVALVVRH